MRISGRATSEIGSFTYQTRLGFRVRGNDLRPNFHPTAQDSCKRIGYMVAEVTMDAVRMCNGQNGKPLWMTIGDNVYDLTGMASPPTPFSGPPPS